MIEAITIVLLLVFIVTREWFDRQERKRLIEMLMAKNLMEFKEAENEEKKNVKERIEPQPDLMPLDTVSDEQFMSAIKEDLGRTPMKEKFSRAIKKKLGSKIYE